MTIAEEYAPGGAEWAKEQVDPQEAMRRVVFEKYPELIPPVGAAARQPLKQRKTKSPPPRKFSTKIVGVTALDEYPGNVHFLNNFWDQISNDPEVAPGLPAWVIRDPENPHDVNAIEVHVGETRIGYIPANAAVRFADLMDSGIEYAAHITDVRVHPDHPDKPGVTVRLTRQ